MQMLELLCVCGDCVCVCVVLISARVWDTWTDFILVSILVQAEQRLVHGGLSHRTTHIYDSTLERGQREDSQPLTPRIQRLTPRIRNCAGGWRGVRIKEYKEFEKYNTGIR
jgi:hypothetical protein